MKKVIIVSLFMGLGGGVFAANPGLKATVSANNRVQMQFNYGSGACNLTGDTANACYQNRNTVRTQLREQFNALSGDVKKELNQIRNQYRIQIKALIGKIKIATGEERQKLLEQVKQLREKMREEILNKVGNTTYGKMLKEKWDELAKLNELKVKKRNLKKELNQVRNQYREARSEFVEKYKSFIYSKLKAKIDNISLEKLEIVKQRIQKAKEKFEKMNLSEEKKTQIMSILAALDEIITEKIAELQQQLELINNDVLDNILGG